MWVSPHLLLDTTGQKCSFNSLCSEVSCQTALLFQGHYNGHYEECYNYDHLRNALESRIPKLSKQNDMPILIGMQKTPKNVKILKQLHWKIHCKTFMKNKRYMRYLKQKTMRLTQLLLLPSILLHWSTHSIILNCLSTPKRLQDHNQMSTKLMVLETLQFHPQKGFSIYALFRVDETPGYFLVKCYMILLNS